MQPREAVSRARRRRRAHAARAVRVRHRPGERATERWRRLREGIALGPPERRRQLRPLAVRPVRPRRRARLRRAPISAPRRAGSAAPRRDQRPRGGAGRRAEWGARGGAGARWGGGTQSRGLGATRPCAAPTRLSPP